MDRVFQLADQLDDVNLKVLADLETSTMADMYERMTSACQKKCLNKYDSDRLVKEEGVCVDRCVSKFLDLHEKVGKRLTTIQQQDEQLISRLRPETFIKSKSMERGGGGGDGGGGDGGGGEEVSESNLAQQTYAHLLNQNKS